MEKIKASSLAEQLGTLTEEITQYKLGKATIGLEDILKSRGISKEAIPEVKEQLLEDAGLSKKQKELRTWIEAKIAKRKRI